MEQQIIKITKRYIARTLDYDLELEKQLDYYKNDLRKLLNEYLGDEHARALIIELSLFIENMDKGIPIKRVFWSIKDKLFSLVWLEDESN